MGIMPQTALITGASGGIGSEIAREFARKGYNIVVHYHKNKDRADQLCRELQAFGAEALPFGADLTQEEDVKRLFVAAFSRFGKIDVLVNNAAISLWKLLTDMTEADWDSVFSINVKSLFLTCREVLPSMVAEKAGKIINISSVWGITGASCEVAYSAAKGAIIAFTKALAKEVGPSGIQVNCVAPGVIDTPMNNNLTAEDLTALIEETPAGKIGLPIDVAKAVCFLASSDSDFITGQVLSPNGGFVI